MSFSIIVVIKQDPFASHKAVEALRIALGLSTGTSELSIILLGRARSILTEDIGDMLDADILEKHLPVIQELEIPFIVPEGTSQSFPLDPGYAVKEASLSSIRDRIRDSDRVMVF